MLNESINRFLGIFSYPLLSVDFLKDDIMHKYFKLQKKLYSNNQNAHSKDETIKELKKYTERIRKDFCKFINEKYTIYNYDEIYQYLDLWYLYPKYQQQFNLDNEEINFFNHIWNLLENFTTCFITQRDGGIFYKYWENENDKKFLYGFSGNNKIYLFHSLNRLISMDLLVMIYFVKSNKTIDELNGYYGHIGVSDLMLDKILEKGVAENHLHAGVASSFLTTWSILTRPVTPLNHKCFDELPNLSNDRGNKKENKFYIWLAGLIKGKLMAKYNLDGSINENIIINNDEDNKITCVDEYINFPFNNERKFLKMQHYFLDSDDELIDYTLNKWDKLLKIDNLKIWEEKANKLNTSEELLFVFVMTKSITNNKIPVKDKMYFLNYIRIKNYIYAQMVQPKNIKGLSYFQSEYYNKNSDFHQTSMALNGENRLKRAMKEQFQNNQLVKLELRATIKTNEAEFKKSIIDFLKDYKNIIENDYCTEQNNEFIPCRKFPRVALVYHLIKRETSHFEEICFKFSDNTYAIKYLNLYKEYKSQIQLMQKVRAKYGLEDYIVGIDVASEESAIPTWVFANIFENARDSYSESFSSKKQSLSFTFHAGEDFRHMLSGLRRIYEAIRYLKFHAGDRIGHGIALGLNYMDWYAQNPTVIIPRIEALENYLWIYDVLSEGDNHFAYTNSIYIENRILELANEIYGGDFEISIKTLLESYRNLFLNKNLFEELEKNNCQNCNENYNCILKQDKISSIKNLFLSRHCQNYIHKMEQPIHYKITEQEKEITNAMQEYMQQYVSGKGIVIEINPSSNVILGEFDSLNQLHMHNLNKVRHDYKNVLTCINSDDPSVFNTNVVNELGYVYFDMIENKVAKEDVLAWIDKIRRVGMNASFIRNDDNDDVILKKLNFIINGF